MDAELESERNSSAFVVPPRFNQRFTKGWRRGVKSLLKAGAHAAGSIEAFMAPLLRASLGSGP